jgi:processive 1,2-diacylglycerol beta-glucosyltransferase
MTERKRILILYITERSGHHSAALAIKKGIELRDPEADVLCVNAFKYAFPISEKVIHRIYLFIIKRVPVIWKKMYDNPKLIARSQRIKKWIHGLAVRRIKAILDRFEPSVVICTQAFPCGIVAYYKNTYASKIPLFGVMTDFAPHSFWVYEDVDYYIAPSEEARNHLVDKGVPADKIKILGIPIDPKFAQQLDRLEIIFNYGLKPDVPVVMIMGGGHGLGPIKEVLSILDSLDRELQLVVVCGLNRRLYDWLIRVRFQKKVLIFKFTDQIDRLMTLSSFIITKPGGITTAEALAKNLPMIILNPIPGQEARNTQALIKCGAALKMDNLEALLPAVEEILGVRGKKGGILDAIHHLSRPQSSLDIADFTLNHVGNDPTILS